MSSQYPSAIEGAMEVLHFEQGRSLQQAQTQHIKSETQELQQRSRLEAAKAPMQLQMLAAQAKHMQAETDQIEMNVKSQQQMREIMMKRAKARMAQQSQPSSPADTDYSKQAWETYEDMLAAGNVAGAEKAATTATKIDSSQRMVKSAETRDQLVKVQTAAKKADAIMGLLNGVHDQASLDMANNIYERNFGQKSPYSGRAYDPNEIDVLKNSTLKQKDRLELAIKNANEASQEAARTHTARNQDAMLRLRGAEVDIRESHEASWEKHRGVMDESLIHSRAHTQAIQDQTLELRKQKDQAAMAHMSTEEKLSYQRFNATTAHMNRQDKLAAERLASTEGHQKALESIARDRFDQSTAHMGVEEKLQAGRLAATIGHDKFLEQLGRDKFKEATSHMSKQDKLSAERLAATVGHDRAMESIAKQRLERSSTKEGGLLPPERAIKDATSMVTSRFKGFTGGEERRLGTELAERATSLVRAHPGMTWTDGMGQAFNDMRSTGTFKSYKALSTGHNQDNAESLPTDKKQLKEGMWYKTEHGPIYWNGKVGLTPEEYGMHDIPDGTDPLQEDENDVLDGVED